MELEITWSRVVRIWLSYLWRNLIAIVVSMLIGMVVGGVIGFIMGAMGFPLETIKIVVAPTGFLIGVIISIVPMKMILGMDFGEFRLVLLAKQPLAGPADNTPAAVE